MKPVRILKSAQADIRSEKGYYRKISPDLARRFHFAVESTVKAIPHQPLAMQVLEYEVRRWPIDHGFRHGVLYRVLDSEILVLAVFHPSQNPGKWKARART